MISTARHKMKMKTQPSVDERKEAVFDMKNNKFSGLDEIPCKFYQYIWSLIGCYFMKYYYPFYNQEISFSQRIPLIKDIKHFFYHRLNVNKLITKS